MVSMTTVFGPVPVQLFSERINSTDMQPHAAAHVVEKRTDNGIDIHNVIIYTSPNSGRADSLGRPCTLYRWHGEIPYCSHYRHGAR